LVDEALIEIKIQLVKNEIHLKERFLCVFSLISVKVLKSLSERSCPWI